MRIRRPPAGRLLDVAFLAMFLAYVWAGIDTRLIYHWHGPSFYTTLGFASEFLKYPGGPLDYLYALVAQTYAFQVLGALVVTAQVAAVVALTQVYFTTLAGRPLPFWRFVPAVLLLYTLNLYYDRTPLVEALLLGVAAAIVFVRLSLRWRREAAMLGVFVVMLVAVYYVGGMALVFFAPAAAIVQIASGAGCFVGQAVSPLQAGARLQWGSQSWLPPPFMRRKVGTSRLAVGSEPASPRLAPRRPIRPLAIAWLLLPAALPVAVEKFRLVYLPSSARAWFIDPDMRRAAVWWGLYLFYAIGALICRRLSASGAIADQPTGRSAARRQWPAVAFAAAVFASLGAVALLSYQANARDRRLAALDYYSSGEDWPSVIEASRGLATKDFNSLTRYEINVALHEMNRLGDEMFLFPQVGSMLPRLRPEVFLPYMIRITDLCLRLGRVNEAEHFGNEALILGKSDPRVYHLMARLNMVKGQSVAARKFLTVLLDEPGFSSWARQRLLELDQDPQLAADQTVQLLRRRMLRNDDVIPVWQNPDKPDVDIDRLLLDQLEQDPSNRMAFEFLMGNYLLARDIEAVRGLMPRIRYMTGPAYVSPDGKRRTPRHYQEAMAVYSDSTGKPVDIEGFEIQPDTLNRMAVFKRIVSQAGGKDAAMQAAWDRFRDSYFFYFLFGPGDYR